MSDPGGRGYLDKQGLFMALRLIATVQAGKEPLVTNMALNDPPPKFVGVEVPATPLSNKWSIEVSVSGFSGLWGLSSANGVCFLCGFGWCGKFWVIRSLALLGGLL